DELAAMARAVHAPLLTTPNESWFDTHDRRKGPVVSSDLAGRWKAFRRTERARYLVLVHPKVLLRLPYGRGNTEVEAFNYEEQVAGTDASRYLWGSPTWALAARISDAFSRYGWC